MTLPTTETRSSGILLHPTSLPGPYGIGDLGPEAYRWVQTLHAAKQSWWQILPLNPPSGSEGSPYQSCSAFAGNISLLSPELLARDGLLSRAEAASPGFPSHRVEFDRVIPWKQAMLRAAWGRFRGGDGGSAMKADFDDYCGTQREWLDDYALFMAIREALGNVGLQSWPDDLRLRNPVALEAVANKQEDEVRMHRFGQFLFDRQWTALKNFAHEHDIGIIGDAPIFVALDSADVWAEPHGYLLNADGSPKVRAGVPPDYFAVEGQNWGNPIYDWNAMKADGFRWWRRRLQRNLDQVDLVRLDHFRGFAQAWHIPGTDTTTARNGKWIDGPGAKLFQALKAVIHGLPVIAEDLGLITPDVIALRDAFDLPGMRVLHFMLGDPANLYWPHNFVPNTACYTGTHDNDTTLGWFNTLKDDERTQLNAYLGKPTTDPAFDLIRLAWKSTARLAIAQAQDWFKLGGDARMNTPGTVAGNWQWRFRPEQFPPGAIEELAELTTMTNRIPNAAPDEPKA